MMILRLVIGFALSILCLMHFTIKDGFKLSRTQVVFTCLILLIPFLGPIIYFVWFVWNPPRPAAYRLRQNSQNDLGRTEFGNEQLIKDKSSDLKPDKNIKLKDKGGNS